MQTEHFVRYCWPLRHSIVRSMSETGIVKKWLSRGYGFIEQECNKCLLLFAKNTDEDNHPVAIFARHFHCEIKNRFFVKVVFKFFLFNLFLPLPQNVLLFFALIGGKSCLSKK